MATYYFATSARSAVGLVRSGNEDSALASKNLIAVADGMGGHAAGEVASSLAIKSLVQSAQVFTHPDIDEESADDLYLQAIQEADLSLKSAVEENPALSGMGTTLTSLLLRGTSVALLHIGDSRAYRLRGSAFEQLSVDHTVIQELLNQGAISESDIATHPQRSVLTQVMMGEGNIEVPLPVIDVKVGDRFLVCSDGLSSVLTEKEIKSLLKGKDRDAAVAALVDATYINGAPDNVTLVIGDIVEENQPDTFETIGAAG
jgi:serine/threonine protein phosphatase PrpC